MVELALLAPEAAVEPLAEALMQELDALSVAVEDADAGSEDEAALFGEPGLEAPEPAARAWGRSLVKAQFAEEAQATAAATLLLAQAAHASVQLVGIAPVPDEDWVRLTQAQFAPVPITPSFYIVPSWHAVPAAAERAIHLDPGQAFGTGTHPTTRMCLRWIARASDARGAAMRRVLDYGCGSGILAIAAALHGAEHVDGVDVDPLAVEATRANAARNGVAVQAGGPERAQGRYDLVLANILAKPLELLAPLLAAHVAPGGSLVLAGLLERQADALARVYAPWCALDVADREDGWALLAGRFPA